MMTKKERLGYAALAVFGITVAMWIPAGYTEGLGVLFAIIPLTIAVFYYGFSLTQNQQAQTDREQELLKRLEHMEQELAKLAGEQNQQDKLCWAMNKILVTKNLNSACQKTKLYFV